MIILDYIRIYIILDVSVIIKYFSSLSYIF